MTVALLVCVACGGPSDGSVSQEPTVRDSLGVRMVEPGGLDERLAPFRVADDPDYRVGWQEGEPEFANVRFGTLLSDGRAVVLDNMTREVVFLDPSGHEEARLGGPGQAPGEFSLFLAVTSIGQDTVLIQDPGLFRLSFYHDQVLVRTLHLEMIPAMAALVGDGSGGLLLGSQPEIVLARAESPGTWISFPLLRADLTTGQADTVGLFDLMEAPDWSPDGRSIRNPFAPFGYSDAWSGGFVTARSDIPEIRWHDVDGQLTQIFRWDPELVPLSDSILNAYEAWYRSTNMGNPSSPEPAVSEARLAQNLDQARGPMPLFGELKTGPGGDVWLARYVYGEREPTGFHVVAEDGEWLGALTLHRAMRILDISRDQVLVVELNEFGVPAVARYRIEQTP